MKSLFICASCLLGSVAAMSLPSLERRQANSAIAASAFRRRAYGQSAVLDGYLYIDGGEFAYSGGDSITYQYSSTLLAIDLSQDWTNSTVNIRSSSKPSGAPTLVEGGIWADSDNHLLYTGFAGRQSTFGNNAPQNYGLWSFKPDGAGGGSWTNLNSSADANFQSQPRPFAANIASGGGVGYMLGGFAVNSSQTDVRYSAISISGLVAYDFRSKTLSNNTIAGTSVGGMNQKGGLVYSPNFGSKGILVSIGGNQVGKVKAGSDALISMETVQVYDVASGSWYEQSVTGNIPESRKEFCMAGVASNNKTFDILLYAGWDGHLGGSSIPFDEAYVLTLPGFNWVKAPYSAAHPRHGLTCNSIGGGQMLTIGGVDTTQNEVDLYKHVFDTADPFTSGLAVFDMATLSFKNNYSPKQTSYSISSDIANFYSNNARMPAFSNSALQKVFETQNFTAAAITSTSGQNSTIGSGSTSSSSSGSHTGAIVGGVVGGVVILIVLVALALLCIRRRRRAHEGPAHASVAPHYSQVPIEMHGDAKVAELPPAGGHAAGNMTEMERKRYPAVHQAGGTLSELPGHNNGRHSAPPTELPS